MDQSQADEDESEPVKKRLKRNDSEDRSEGEDVGDDSVEDEQIAVDNIEDDDDDDDDDEDADSRNVDTDEEE